MWNESSVGGGGGFLDESTQGGGAGRKGPQTNDKSIVPLLIKHIANATGDLQIGGKTINTVTIVGIVRRIEQDTTKISYTIQDDTGLCVILPQFVNKIKSIYVCIIILFVYNRHQIRNLISPRV
jgi:hypothetical protein